MFEKSNQNSNLNQLPNNAVGENSLCQEKANETERKLIDAIIKCTREELDESLAQHRDKSTLIEPIIRCTREELDESLAQHRDKSTLIEPIIKCTREELDESLNQFRHQESPKPSTTDSLQPQTVDNQNESTPTAYTFEEKSQPTEISKSFIDNRILKPIDSELTANKKIAEFFYPHKPPRQETQELKPMEIADKFSTRCKVFFVDERMYAYNGIYFQHHDRLAALRLIAQIFRDEISAKGTPSYVKAIYESLLITPKTKYEVFPADDPVVAFQNYTFSLKDRSLHAHSPNWLINYGIQSNYQCGPVSCPHFDKFLFDASCGNKAWMDRVYEVIGHLITPHRGKTKFFVFQGVPNSGKSMLAEFILSLFNAEATITMRLERLSAPFSISELQDKAIWMAPEKSSKSLDADTVALIKTLVGGDRITAEEKNKQMVRFINKAKPLIVTNYPLLPKVYDEAFYQRAVTIPFQYAVPSGSEDPLLPEKFAAEKDAIVTKALHKYLEMLDSGKSFSGEFALNEVVMDIQGYSTETSVEGTVYQFVQSYLVEDEQSGIFAEDALSCFLTQIGSISENSFSKLFKKYVLEVYGIVQKRERKPGQKNPQSFYPGLKLKECTFAPSTN